MFIHCLAWQWYSIFLKLPMPCVPNFSYKCRWTTPQPSMSGLAGLNTPRKSWFMGTNQRPSAMFTAWSSPILSSLPSKLSYLGGPHGPHLAMDLTFSRSGSNSNLGQTTTGKRRGSHRPRTQRCKVGCRSPPSQPKKIEKECTVGSWDVRSLYTL